MGRRPQKGSRGARTRTLEVVHEARLRSDHPLGPGLTEDGDVGLGLLTQCLQAISKIESANEDIFIGEPIVASENNLIKQTKTYK